jgi:hypothetical protein
MSKRLQVRRERMSVGEWVRRALRDARASRPVIDPETKLKAVRRGAQYSFPSADMEQMLGEIERGRQQRCKG